MNYNVAARLRELIDSKGFKITFVAQQLGISIDLLSKKLKGDVRITCEEFLRMCDILGISADSFRTPAA